MQTQLNSTVPEAEIPRLGAQHEKLLKLVKKGPVSNVELAQQVGLRYSARIHELRKAGYNIRRVAYHSKTGLNYYALVKENNVA
jgi:biotin operon repressor